MSLVEVHSFTEDHGSSEQDNGEIANSYADFAIRHYGPATTVVFDGYEEWPSIKDNTKYKMAACLRGNSRWPLFFCKIVYVIADPQMYRSFESIKNSQRCDFVNIFEIPGGNAPPPTNSNGGYFCPPSKSKWEVPRNNPHHLAKL